MTLLIYILFIILGDFILRTLLWFGLGKIFKIEDATIKKAFQACLFYIALYIILSVILNFLFEIPLARTIITMASLFFGIYILKVIFDTTYIKSVAIIIPSLLIIGCFTVVMTINMVQNYKIVSAGNKPTLINGDRVLVNKYVYNSNEPKIGDLILFPYANDPGVPYVKRIIGREGDKIEIKNDILYVNDEQVPLKKVGVYEDAIIKEADEYIETLGDHKYHILDQYQRNDSFGPVIVPENTFFVLGDNRDNSEDSRHYGFVDKRNVKGKAEIIIWSKTPNKFHINWSRIGNTL